MTTSSKTHKSTALALSGVGLTLSATALFSGCTVQVAGPPPPPPPRVYVAPPPPPPPPAYADAPEVEVRATEPPPPLPDYDQPPCPEDGYLWTPGYWAYGPGGYFWVPGTWVEPPRVGVLWTPGYWGFVGGVYAFHAGYWGPHVGFYGGVNYGFGYVGVGFAGGRWAGNSFAYNRTVTNINVTNIHNTYNETVVNNVTVNKVSYNGGAGGVAAVPTAQERAAATEPHVPPTPLQRQHVQEAVKNPALFAKANGGHPAIAATPKPAAFNAPGVVGARGAAPLPQHAMEAPTRATGAPTPGGAPNAAHGEARPEVHNEAAGQPPAMHAQAPAGARPPAPQAGKAPPPKAPPKPKPEPKKHEEGDKH